MTTVRFTARGSRHYTVNFPYDAAVVAMIKTVPSHARTYEPDTKTWTVQADYAQVLDNDLRGIGCTVIGIEQTNDWAKTLLNAVGPDRADAVVRALSKVLHPDNPNGDAELQRQLNTARDEIGRPR
jgi:hypothetical protein